jgi:hypothetical protein
MSDLVEQAAFLREAASYFEKRDTHGEDKAHWSNVFNAKNCREIADALEAKDAEIERLNKLLYGVKGPVSTRGAIEEAAVFQRDLARASAANERLRKALESAESYLAFLDSCDEGSDEGPIVLAKVREALAALKDIAGESP